MKVKIILLFSILIISCTPDAGKNSKTLKGFNEVIPSLMDKYSIPGVNIAVLRKGEIVWAKAYGYADKENNRKMELDLPCRTESISKSVTTFGLMKLVQEGKIELDKPVVDYIKNWNFPESEYFIDSITVRQLLSHSSGLGLGVIGEHYPPQSQMPDLKQYLTENFKMENNPGEKFYYSNVGFNVLELLIEEVTGQEFAEYMDQNVFTPLNMRNSSFQWRPEYLNRIPNGYSINGEAIAPYVYPDKAAGGLFANIYDIAAFLKSYMPENKFVLKNYYKKMMFTKSVDIPGYYGLVFNGYGLGHFLETFNNDKIGVSHGGQGSGWMTHFHFVPVTGDGIIILCNSQRSWPFFSEVLSDWSYLQGYDNIGMGLIAESGKYMIAILFVVVLLSAVNIFKTAKKIIKRSYIFNPQNVCSNIFGFLQMGIGIALVFVLIVIMNLQYFFLESVYPLLFPFFLFALGLAAVAFLLSSVFSKKE